MQLVYNAERKKPRSLEELQKTLRRGEGLHLEFKFKAKYPDKIIKEMTAFANTEGGELIIGVNDNGSLAGLKFADEEEFVLIRELEREISPKLDYALERIRIPQEKEILVFHIPKSKQKPHKIGKEGKVYVRHKDKTIQASKEIREILKGINKGKSLRFNYGDKERLLMQYLTENKSITLNKFCEIANIPKKIASRTLVLMVLTNVLQYQAKDNEDVYYPV